MQESLDEIPLPPSELLAHSAPAADTDVEAEAGARTLTALFHQFGIDAHTAGYTRGPAVVSHHVEAGSAGSLTQIRALARNIEYALPNAQVAADLEGGRVTVYVPSSSRSPVLLGDLLDKSAVHTSRPLAAVLGADRNGNPVSVDIADLPHLLMAGTTGSGKSTCLHAILLSVLMRARPDQVRMILIDTRSLELGRYQGVQHLITPPVAKAERAARALAWSVAEAETRLDDLSAAGMRHVKDFNSAVRAGRVGATVSGTAPTGYPLLLIAIDDLADLLRSPQRGEIQDSLLQIGTRGRAAGIHLVAGTRHPQAYAVPPRVGATLPARLSFAATEGPGPTRDLRIGMAVLRVHGSKPVEVWCPQVSDQEIDAVAAHWRCGEDQMNAGPVSTPAGDRTGGGRLARIRPGDESAGPRLRPAARGLAPGSRPPSAR